MCSIPKHASLLVQVNTVSCRTCSVRNPCATAKFPLGVARSICASTAPRCRRSLSRSKGHAVVTSHRHFNLRVEMCHGRTRFVTMINNIGFKCAGFELLFDLCVCDVFNCSKAHSPPPPTPENTMALFRTRCHHWLILRSQIMHTVGSSRRFISHASTCDRTDVLHNQDGDSCPTSLSIHPLTLSHPLSRFKSLMTIQTIIIHDFETGFMNSL